MIRNPYDSEAALAPVRASSGRWAVPPSDGDRKQIEPSSFLWYTVIRAIDEVMKYEISILFQRGNELLEDVFISDPGYVFHRHELGFRLSNEPRKM